MTIELNNKEKNYIIEGLKCYIEKCCEDYIADSDVYKIQYASNLILKINPGLQEVEEWEE